MRGDSPKANGSAAIDTSQVKANVMGLPLDYSNGSAASPESRSKMDSEPLTGSIDDSPQIMKELSRRESQYHEDDPDYVPAWTALYGKKAFEISSLFPPIRWVPAYVRTVLKNPTERDLDLAGSVLPFSVKGDAIAGLTVGFMLVPQCLAFAMLAGLPVEVGLKASFYPLVFYTAFGTIRQVQPGPTALMSLLTGSALDTLNLVSDEERVVGAAALAFVVGTMSVIMGFLRFGFVVDFMSHSVMTAFCCAAGVTIATSQMKHMFGITMPRYPYWFQTFSYLVSHLGESHGPTCALGWGLLCILLTLKQWKGAGDKKKRSAHRLWRFFPVDKEKKTFKALKFIADLSSLLCVVVGWFWGRAYAASGVDVKLVGDLSSGSVDLTWPFVEGAPGFGELFVSGFVMAAVGFLETVAVGGKFAAAARYEYDSNQELVALGLSNLGGALASGYPTTGSFSRTAVNAMFGASSLMACGVSALVVLVASYTLIDVIKVLPLAALAPIIVQGAIGVISTHEFIVAFKVARPEFFVMMATFVVSLVQTVKEGLLVGFVFSILNTMHQLAHPNLVLCGRLPDGNWRDVRNFLAAVPLEGCVVIRMDARINFANARKLKEFVIRAVQDRERRGYQVKYAIIDAKSINDCDLSGIETLESLVEGLKKTGQQLMLANLKGPLSARLNSSHFPQMLRKNGGALCTDMSQAEGIVMGKDSSEAWKQTDELVEHVKSAKRVQNTVSAQGIGGVCGGAQGICGNTLTASANRPHLEVAYSSSRAQLSKTNSDLSENGSGRTNGNQSNGNHSPV